MAVNLLPVEAKANSAQDSLRRKVYSYTTIILIGYLVTVAAVGGWWVFLATRQSQLSQEVVELSTQVQKFASLEASIRQQAHRSQSIEDFLASRKLLSSDLAKLVTGDSPVAISSWSHSLTGQQSVSVTASSAAELEAHINRVALVFPNVSASSIARGTGGWTATIDLGGKKP